jgi:hypothetical protein
VDSGSCPRVRGRPRDDHQPQSRSVLHTITLILESKHYTVQYDTSNVFVEGLDAGRPCSRRSPSTACRTLCRRQRWIVVDAVDRIPSRARLGSFECGRTPTNTGTTVPTRTRP